MYTFHENQGQFQPKHFKPSHTAAVTDPSKGAVTDKIRVFGATIFVLQLSFHYERKEIDVSIQNYRIGTIRSWQVTSQCSKQKKTTVVKHRDQATPLRAISRR